MELIGLVGRIECGESVTAGYGMNARIIGESSSDWRSSSKSDKDFNEVLTAKASHRVIESKLRQRNVFGKWLDI